MRIRDEIWHTDTHSVWLFLSHTELRPHWEKVNYTEAVLSSFLWILIFPCWLWHAVSPSSSLCLSTESINSEAAQMKVISFSFLKPKPHSSARKPVTICRYATDRKPHPSKLVNRQRALSHSECIDRHPQWYTSIFYSSSQLGCHVTLCKVSVHPQLLVIMLWLYNTTGRVWRWKTLGTHASSSVTIFNKNYNLKVWLFWNKFPYGTGLP